MEQNKTRFINYNGHLYMLTTTKREVFKDGFNFIGLSHVPQGVFKVLERYNHQYQFVYRLLNYKPLPVEWEDKRFIAKDRMLVSVLDMEKGLERFKYHKRLQVFYNKGLECANPNCDRVGHYLLMTLGTTKQDETHGYGIHVDVYTKDLHLMTVDHILPASRGGTYDLKNLRPMCSRCNSKLGVSQAY